MYSKSKAILCLSFFLFLSGIGCKSFDYCVLIENITIAPAQFDMSDLNVLPDAIRDRSTFGLVLDLNWESSIALQTFPAQLHLGNAAYAFSPANTYVLAPKLSAITLVTLFDFSPDYPSGSEIDAVFSARLPSEDPNQVYNFKQLSTALNEEFLNPYPESVVFIPESLPDSSFKMQLAVALAFSNGDTLRDTTEVIEFP